MLVLEGPVGPHQFISVQSLSHVQLFVTPWTVACQVFIELFKFSFLALVVGALDYLDYCDVERFALEQTKIILLFLRLHLITAFQTLLLTMRATSLLLRDSCLR